MGGTGERFDGGRLCLNLVAGWAGRAAEERLGSEERLITWLYGTGLVPADTAIRTESVWLTHFTALRDLLERVMSALLDRRPVPTADLALLNAAALAAPPAPCAVVQEGALTRALAAPPDCASLLGAVARDAVELLTDPVARTQLRRCEGENCALIYLDTSRGRRRRWCSSEVCGNRERVARHRRRSTLTTTQS